MPGVHEALEVDAAGWKPLKRERPELLKPLELFGTGTGFGELDAGGADKMHTHWSFARCTGGAQHLPENNGLAIRLWLAE